MLYGRDDYATFRTKLSHVDWNELFRSNNVDHCTENITESIINAAKYSIPNKTVTVRPSEPLWINSQIKREIQNEKQRSNFTDQGRKETIQRQTD